MDLTDSELPDDIDALKALVRAHAASAYANAQRVVELQDQLSSRVIEIEHLKLTIAKLRRMQFGRKSEKVERQIEQLELRLEDLQADEGAATQADSKKAQHAARVSVANHCPITSNVKSVCIAPSKNTARDAVAR
jgi:TolA-binding protein